MRFLVLPTQCLLLGIFTSLAGAENWPEFRGPTGQGVSSSASVPVAWSVDQNIRWSAEIPGIGWSSPVIWEDRIFVTTAVPVSDGKPNDQELVALCLETSTGKTLWQTRVFIQRHGSAAAIHGKNSHASPTPITDGRHLYVHFGPEGSACLTLDGALVWTMSELRYRPQHGNGGSPILNSGAMIFLCDGADQQFVAALNQKDGSLLWRQDRPPLQTSKKFSFSTPLAIEVEGAWQIVSPGTDRVVAYRPDTGEPIWQFDYTGYSVVPRPVFGHGLLFCSSSFDRPTLYALKLGTGSGRPTVVWETDRGAPHTPSPLLVGDELYFVSDRGVATCVDARSGKVHWIERVGGNYSASPTYASGHVYFQNEDGGTVVIRSGIEHREVARNALPGRTLASYAIADNAIFLRTDKRLYRIQESPAFEATPADSP